MNGHQEVSSKLRELVYSMNDVQRAGSLFGLLSSIEDVIDRHRFMYEDETNEVALAAKVVVTALEEMIKDFYEESLEYKDWSDDFHREVENIRRKLSGQQELPLNWEESK